MTTTLAGDQTDGSQNLSIDISDTDYDTIEEIKDYLDNQTGYSASLPISGNGSGVCSTLADVSSENIKQPASITCQFDSTRYYNEEIVMSKADIESGISGYTCRSFIYPGNKNNEVVEDAVKSAGYLGARTGGDASKASWDLEEGVEIFRILGINTASYIGTGDDNIVENASALIERMAWDGNIGVLYAHSFTEYSLENWCKLLDILEQTDVRVMGLGDAIEYIRHIGSDVNGDEEKWQLTFHDNCNYHLQFSSPCINAGTIVTGLHDQTNPAMDIAGNSVLTVPDIGAYEYVPYSFSADPIAGEAPLEVTFTCTAYDPDGENYTIYYDDGTDPDTNYSGVFTHTYNDVGIFQATCTVIDHEGAPVSSYSFSIEARDSDLDGDGLPYSLENGTCTDPNDPDTDTDGLLDGEKDANQNGQVDVGETDPCNADTDGDGLDDKREVDNMACTNPLVSLADINKNGVVNSTDFNLFKNAYLAKMSEADVNCNAVVNSTDFNLFKNAYLGK